MVLAVWTAGLLADSARAQELAARDGGRPADRYVYEGASLRAALGDIQDRTSYNFLYRDGTIAGKRLTIYADSARLIGALAEALEPQGIRLRVDSSRRQILLLEAPGRERAPPSAVHIMGVVMDGGSGTSLPYATVTWRDGGRLRGTAANEAGIFDLRLPADVRRIELTVSYVGFRPQRIKLDLADEQLAGRLPVRLQPETTFGPEVVVSTHILQSDADTSWHHHLSGGIPAPLGERSAVRTLQTLPSVSIAPAVSSGLNVRGSRADGFQILLDGLPMYSRQHLFGLFDAFNDDVLQTVGLYYGIAPAALQGPPGGTLSFVTRTGSRTAMHASAGVNNTSGRAFLEGPLLDGRGSWLVSGRRSYLNAVDWLNNAGLIGLGLDVGRPTSVPDGPIRPLSDRALTTGDATARFHDLHGKLFYEWPGGGRLAVSGYSGGDATRYEAERLENDLLRGEPVSSTAVTANDWGGSAAGARLQSRFGGAAYASTLAGFSRFASRFSKDDFVYTDPTRSLIPGDTSRHVIRPFSNENELMEWVFEHHLDLSAGSGGVWSAGAAMHHFRIDYAEASTLRDLYSAVHRSAQIDAFFQFEGPVGDQLALAAGVRSHYFTLGRFARISPRARARLFPNLPVSVGAGFSRNHQFIHRLYVEQSTQADIWVPSTPDQPPGWVDHLTAGVYARPGKALFVQIEAYRKRFAYLREHEASAVRRRLQASSRFLDPWLHDNEGLARGIEIMSRMDPGPARWTISYTLSRMDIRNDRVNDGRAYPADWDRRHQITSHLQAALADGWRAYVVWTSASGAPNGLATADTREYARLTAYHRLDAGLFTQHHVGPGVLRLAAAVYNLTDRRNAWYRAPIAVVARAPDGGRRVGLVNVDVYDLGFQPSFEVAYRF